MTLFATRTTAAVAALTLLSTVAMGCDASDSPLQADLNERKTSRYAEAAGKVQAVEDERLAAMKATLPAADVKTEAGSPNPLVKWRTDIAAPKPPESAAPAAAGDDGEPAPVVKQGIAAKIELLEGLMDTYKGAPSEPAARAGVAFLQASEEYWKKGKNLERYDKFLKGYIKEGERLAKENAGKEEFQARPFMQEAAFDLMFLHTARWLKMRDSGASLTTIFSYWQLAFNYPAKSREGFSAYITRLCLASSIRDKCNKVVHEMRPLAVNKPYMEWAKQAANDFLTKHKEPTLQEVAKRFITQLDVALKEVPDFTEDPILPSTLSSRAASGGLRLKISKKLGVKLHTTAVSESFAGKIPGNLKSEADKVVQTLKDTPGNTVDYERIVLEMPGNVSGRALGKVFGAFSTEIVRQFDLVGRRRVDESLRRNGVIVRLPAPDEGTTTSYTFNGGSKTSCQYLGKAGKSAIGRKEPGHYFVVGKESAKIAKLSRDEEGKLSASEKVTEIALKDTAALAKWADDNEGIVRFFINGGQHSYDDIMSTMTQVLYKCQDVEVLLDEMGAKKMKVTCGKASARDITLVFGLCG
ncbi:MAG: hypothetical protein ACPGU1_07065 [Myxococcota bacterium]